MMAHLKKQNVFFYISALISVAIMALMFVPWITEPKSASLLTILLDCMLVPKPQIDLLVFMIPLMLGVLLIHIMYLVTIFMPDRDPIYSPTVSLLLVGLMIFVFVFGTDIAYSAITVTNKVYTDEFLVFIGADHWTWIPVIWFVLALVQSFITKFAHKKEVISYT